MNNRYVLVCLFTLIIANYLLSDEEKEGKDLSGWAKTDTKHYRMYFQDGLDKKDIEFYKKYAEVLYSQFAKAFKYQETGKEGKLLFFMYASREKYVADHNPAMALAYYQSKELDDEEKKQGGLPFIMRELPQKKMVSYMVEKDKKEELQKTIAHEMTHQFCDIAFLRFNDQPYWFIEGMAECIGGNSNYVNDKLKINALNTSRAKHGLDIVRSAISGGSGKKMMTDIIDNAVPRTSFTFYAFSFTFCHFLWNTKDPKILPILPKMIDGYKKPDTDPKKLFADFVNKVGKEYLIEQWQSHVSQMQE